jgi:hypothetical protein
MGHLIVGAGVGLAAFAVLALQGAGIGAALSAYAVAGGVATLALDLVPEIVAGRIAGPAPARRRPEAATP